MLWHGDRVCSPTFDVEIEGAPPGITLNVAFHGLRQNRGACFRVAEQTCNPSLLRVVGLVESRQGQVIRREDHLLRITNGSQRLEGFFIVSEPELRACY